MKGVNRLELNQETMNEALEQYLNSKLYRQESVKVTHVEKAVETFVVIFKKREEEGE